MRFRLIGRRGAALLFFGLLSASVGMSMITSPSKTISKATYILPIEMWVGLWMLAGLLSFVFAFRNHDRIGFSAVTFMMTTWSVFNLWAWTQGLYRGWVSAITWLIFAAFTFVIGGWPEPVQLDPAIERDLPDELAASPSAVDGGEAT